MWRLIPDKSKSAVLRLLIDDLLDAVEVGGDDVLGGIMARVIKLDVFSPMLRRKDDANG